MVKNDKEERENIFLSRYSFPSGNFGLKFVRAVSRKVWLLR